MLSIPPKVEYEITAVFAGSCSFSQCNKGLTTGMDLKQQNDSAVQYHHIIEDRALFSQGLTCLTVARKYARPTARPMGYCTEHDGLLLRFLFPIFFQRVAKGIAHVLSSAFTVAAGPREKVAVLAVEQRRSATRR